jgi:endonuclease/exonuclease/phosphatase family metal-dependent hydrolase
MNTTTDGLTITTWNLQGSKGIDTATVVEHVQATATDVLVLQEVQRSQARALSRALDPQSFSWGFKHWPLTTWPEGMAVLGLTVPVHDVRTRPLTHRWRPWSWRRRVFQVGRVPAGPALPPFHLVNVHLTPHVHSTAEDRRAGELPVILSQLTRPAVVAGDFNTEPRSGPWQQMADAGFTTPDKSETKWRGEPSDRQPERHIDYIWVSTAFQVAEVHVPRHGEPGFSALPAVSDHLPVTAQVVG